MKTIAFSAALLLGSTLFCGVARAGDTSQAVPPGSASVCSESYVGAQNQMRRGTPGETSLMKARENLRTCLQSNCADWMVSDCVRWLTEVEERIPTVVFAARDTTGQDLTDVRVTTTEGTVLVRSLDGRAIETEPGVRSYVFKRPDGTEREARAVVREGERARVVSVTFDAPTSAGSPKVPLGTTPEAAAITAAPTLRWIGYGIAGLGVIGLGVGTAFGVSAISAKSAGNCDDAGLCDTGTRDKVYQSGNISTASFVAGGVLLAAGVVMVLLSPTHPTPAAAGRPNSGAGNKLVFSW